MKLLRTFLVACFLCWPRLVLAVTPEDSIRQVLEQQVEAWNNGDLARFVASYAAQCTLVGSAISETSREQVLAHYREKYPSAGARGMLAFSDLHVHLLDEHVATVTAHWRLKRAPGFGGPVGGVFSLVFQRVDGQWEIVLDHTS